MWRYSLHRNRFFLFGLLVAFSSLFLLFIPEVYAEQNNNVTNYCGSFIWGELDIEKCLEQSLGFITLIILQLISWAFGLIGLFFDFIIEATIIDIAGQLAGNTGLQAGIQEAWKLIRDLVNLSFIFILLYQSIMLILGRTGDVGKTIVRLVMVALLINFSMFVTRVVVDASNVVATGFYDQINPQNQPGVVPLSEQYMRALGVASLFDGGIDQVITQGAAQGNGYIVVLRNLGASVFITVTAFVFLAAALMLLVRYIIILFLMILSPVAFAGYIVPGTKDLSSKWWQTLIGQAIFAPLFMILTWVNLTLASRLFSAQGGQDLGQIFTEIGTGNATNNIMSALFNFSLLIGLALASIIIAKQFANKGGNSFKVISNYVGGAALGGAALIGRNTAGRVGASFASSQSLKDAAAKGGLKGYAAKMALKSGDYAASATYDGRNAPLGIGKQVFGSDFGKATKTNYKKLVDDKAKKKLDFAKSLGHDPRKVGALNEKKEVLQNEEKERKERIKENEIRVKELEKEGKEVPRALGYALQKDKEASKKYKENVKGVEDEIKAEKLRRMSEYKDTLERGPLGIRSIIARTEKARGVDESILASNREAARKIDKELKKGNREKLIDDLKKELDGDEKKDKKDENKEDKDEE